MSKHTDLRGIDGTNVLTPDEAELLAKFRSMDKEAQEMTLATARSQARRWPKERPRLTLVPPGQHGGMYGF